MTYTLTCPDEDCGHEFKHEAETASLVEGGDLITCPECGDAWAWELAEDGTLELLPDGEDDGFEDDDEDEIDPDGLEDEEEEDESPE